MPVRVIVTEGTRADCKEACALIDGLSAGALLADRGYDTESILRKAGESGFQVVIPPKRSRKESIAKRMIKYLLFARSHEIWQREIL